jgi:hypothetical protein
MSESATPIHDCAQACGKVLDADSNGAAYIAMKLAPIIRETLTPTLAKLDAEKSELTLSLEKERAEVKRLKESIQSMVNLLDSEIDLSDYGHSEVVALADGNTAAHQIGTRALNGSTVKMEGGRE